MSSPISRWLLCGWLAGALPAGCGRKEPERKPGPPVVEVLPVIRRDVPVYREWIGTLQGFVNAEIHAQVSGYLVAQVYREGSFVRKGEPLFEIDARPAQAQYEEAQANLARAQAAQARAEMDELRSRRLFERDVISASEHDERVEAARVARADAMAQAASVAASAVNLGFTRVLAPIDGMVGIARAQIGDLVGPSTQALATISRIDPIKAYVTVSEQRYIGFTRHYLTRASRSQKEDELRMTMILADGSTLPYPGRFYAADTEVNSQTGALRFAGVFPNPDHSLLPGLFCRVRARTEMHPNALLVPQRAVIERQGSYQVATVTREGKVSLRTVVPGERYGQLWLIEKGLEPGMTVIVEGTQKAREGALVSSRPWKAPEGALELPRQPGPDSGAGPLPTVPPDLLGPPPVASPPRLALPGPAATPGRGDGPLRSRTIGDAPAPIHHRQGK